MDLRTHDVVTTPWKDSKEMDPVWVGGNVYFLSDRDGVSNVWRYDMGTKALTQLTKFTDFDVKALDGNGSALVFEQAGYIHEIDVGTSRSRQVRITAAGDFPWMMAQWKDLSNRVTNLAISATRGSNPHARRVLPKTSQCFSIPPEAPTSASEKG